MNAQLIEIVKDCTVGSDQDAMPFPAVVARLAGAGVERYHADLRRAEKVYYMPDGASHVVAAAPVDAETPEAFRPDGVEAAVRAIQAGAIGYRTFCERIASAGCVGYMVSIAGRRAVYYGRSGECFVEPFPAAR